MWVQYWEKRYLEAKGEKEQAFDALGMALDVGAPSLILSLITGGEPICTQVADAGEGVLLEGSVSLECK